MRALVLFLVLVATGCGAGSGTQKAHMLVGSGNFPPAISMLEPNSAPVESPGFTIIVVGTNFGPDSVVFWNGQPTSTLIVNSRQLMAQITDVDMQMAGMVPIFVRTGGQNSNSVNFDVLIQ